MKQFIKDMVSSLLYFKIFFFNSETNSIGRKFEDGQSCHNFPGNYGIFSLGTKRTKGEILYPISGRFLTRKLNQRSEKQSVTYFWR